MIVKVRIAPVEQWTEWHPGGRFQPGDEVEIDTATCAVDPPRLNLEGHPTGNRWWIVGQTTWERYATHPTRRWICEHMLELD